MLPIITPSTNTSISTMVPRAEDHVSQYSGQGSPELAIPYAQHKASESYIVPYIEHGTPHSLGQVVWPRQSFISPDTSRRSGLSQREDVEIQHYHRSVHQQAPTYLQYQGVDRKHRGRTFVDHRRSTINGTTSRNETLRDSMASYPPRPEPSMTQRKRKKGGLRLAIRRLFGRRSTATEIALPDPSVRHQSVSRQENCFVFYIPTNTFTGSCRLYHFSNPTSNTTVYFNAFQ